MDQVAKIRERTDLVALIAEFIPVKRAGRNIKALCPFHGEKTPSFVISPERQIWHCFGCQKGGDVYTFLMEYEHIEFPEALRLLAKRTGIVLDEPQYVAEAASKKEKIYKVNRLAAEFYHYVLTKHNAGRRARDYLLTRGVTNKVIDSFLLGFAPNMGNGLASYLMQKKKYDKETLFEAGLISFRGRDIIDFFRGRIMFPLLDHRDNIVGFSGRVLEDSKSMKYINTRDTLVYHKGQLFFGLNMTKDAIRKHNQAILVEGEFDVLSCFQHGIPNVVAIKGTALTEMQVSLLSRFTEKVTMCFDGDSAGQEAIKRSLPLLEKKGLATTVVIIPQGKDPDESLKKNPGQFLKAVNEDQNVYDFLLDHLAKENDVFSVTGKKKIAQEILPLLANIENEIVKEHFLRKVSKTLGTSYESLQKELGRKIKIEQKVAVPLAAQVKKDREETLEEYLLSLILQHENVKGAFDSAMNILLLMLPKERAQQKMFFLLQEFFAGGKTFDNKIFGEIIPKELLDIYNKSLLFPIPVFADELRMTQEIGKIARILKESYIKKKLQYLTDQIKKKDASDEEGLEALKQEFSTLVSKLET